MQLQPGRHIPHPVLRVLRVVAAQQGPETLALVAVDLFYPGFALFVGQHRHRIGQHRAVETGRLPEKILDIVRVVLNQQRRYGVIFGREIEKFEIA